MQKNIISIMALSAALFLTPLANAAEAPKEEVQTGEVIEDAVVEEEKTALEITEVWARQSIAPNNNSAAYMKINNPTKKQITIVSAFATSVANNVELHKSFVDEKGISRMVAIDNIVIPAESQIELKPGGIHIMLFDLRRHIKPGDKFEMILKVKDSDPITVESEVR